MKSIEPCDANEFNYPCTQSLTNAVNRNRTILGDPIVDGGQLLTKPNTASTILAAAKTTKEFFVNDMSSRNQTNQGHIAGEGPFLKSLCEFWKPHQRTDLENRYNLGVMLNIKLGDPKVRQKHPGTIRRISKELSIDKSDISRMRRFADKYESFDAFTLSLIHISEPTRPY